MAFTITYAKRKTCGQKHIVPGGQLKGAGYDDCPTCRDKKKAEACEWCGYRVTSPCKTAEHRANCENS